MYEYQIKSIGLHYTRDGFSLAEEYEQLIASYAKDGWRFVQLVNLSELSPNERRVGLIFERKKGERKVT